MTYYFTKTTPAGEILLIGDKHTVSGIHWRVFKRTPKIGKDWISDEKVFAKPLRQIDEYFKGKRTTFDFPYAAHGTDFQKRVWKELEKIPFGTSVSYKDIARKIRKPAAVRAVGTAIGSNPISIVVPCHRVLTSAGKLGGYAGGLKSKKILLSCEGILVI